MICIVTFNPALDYVVKVNHFTLGMVNRIVQKDIYYGGRGINVSTVLRNLGYDNTALGFVAGSTGDKIIRGAKTLGFIPDFTRVEHGISRINVKIKSDEESEVNGMGPETTLKDVEKLFEKLEEPADGDILILSGSIPKSVNDDTHENIMTRLDGRGTRIVVDAEKNLLLSVLQYHSLLTKSNNHELGDMFGVVLNGDGEIMEYVKKLQERGIRNVSISIVGDRAILVDKTGKTHRMGAPKGTIRNSAGAGDSMVAEFVAGYLERQDYGHALRLGSAAGGASVLSEGLTSKEDIVKLYQELSGETGKVHACTGRSGDEQEG